MKAPKQPHLQDHFQKFRGYSQEHYPVQPMPIFHAPNVRRIEDIQRGQYRRTNISLCVNTVFTLHNIRHYICTDILNYACSGFLVYFRVW